MLLFIGNLLAAAAAAQAAPDNSLSKAEAEAAARNCDSRRFQSIAEAIVGGEKKRATIMLCAKAGETEAQWKETLKKAAAQIAASPTISPESKAKLRVELDAAIANVGSSSLAGLAPIPRGTTIGSSPAPTLPPLASNRPTRAAPLSAQDRLVSTVPPLPAPLPPRAVAAGSALSLLPPVRLTIRCLRSGEGGGGDSCEEVLNNTTFVVRAEQSSAGPVRLRFLRDGEVRAERELGTVRKDQVARVRIPYDVCRGVVRSELEVSSVVTDPKTHSERSGVVLGPVDLRC